MKRLTIVIFLLSVCQLATAQPDLRFTGEMFQYKLKWSLLGFDWLSPKAGEAYLWCEPTTDAGCLLGFWGHSVFPASLIKSVADGAWVKIDSLGRIKRIIHQTKKNTEIWLTSPNPNEILYFRNDSLQNKLNVREHYPLDALSAIFLLRNRQLTVGYQEHFQIVGLDSTRTISVWKSASVIVIGQEPQKVLGQKIDCWVIQISVDPSDNLFPGGKIKLWATADDRLIPVRVESDLHLAGLLPSTVVAILEYQKP